MQQEILNAQSSLIDAQSRQTTLTETVGALKEQIARIKAWDRDKERYALVPIFAGALAYALKEECKGSEPPHWVCTRCSEDGFKSILNPRHERQMFCYVCPRCSAVIDSDLGAFMSPEYARSKKIG